MARIANLLLLSSCLAVSVLGCGSHCGPDNCANGCCDANGVCQLPASDHCGAQGGACSTCVGSQQCVSGVCSFGGSGANGSSTNGSSTNTGSTTGGTSGGVPPDCVQQCTTLASTCGEDPSPCSSVCASITGAQFDCLMNAGCDPQASSACLNGSTTTSTTTGTTASTTTGSTNSGTTGSTGSCQGLGETCNGFGDCCSHPGGVSCTQRSGTQSDVCCLSVGQGCGDANDCCSLSCSSSGACCYDSSWSCAPAGSADADCCSGQCGSNGLCAP